MPNKKSNNAWGVVLRRPDGKVINVERSFQIKTSNGFIYVEFPIEATPVDIEDAMS